MKLSIIFSLLTIVITGHSQSNPELKQKEYQAEKYQINYPDTWQLDISKTLGADLFIFSPVENGSDSFRENVNVIIQDLKGQNISLETYKEITDKQMARLVTDLKVFESVVDNASNVPFYRVSYSMTQGKFQLRIISKCLIKDGNAYLVTFTSELDKFDHYSSIANEIVESFGLR